MKKTRSTALILLAVVILSISMIGSTFAKYVTKATGSDSARVAKWGVELSITGDNFSNQYATHDSANYDGDFSVSTSTDKLVAPGTSSSDVDGNVYFEITGSPEVATKIDIALTNVEDVFLKAGTYTDYTNVTGYDEDGKQTYGTFTLANNYYPVNWTLKQVEAAGVACDVTVATGRLADIKDFLDGYNLDNTKSSYDPDQNIGAKFELTWAWAYGNYATDAGYDAADTFLGNLAANAATYGANLTDGTDYNLEVKYDLAIAATQVD